MVPRSKRVAVGLLAALAIGLGIGVSGPFAFALGLIAFLALPQLLEPKVGATLLADAGTLIVTARTSSDRAFHVVRGAGTMAWLLYAWLGQTRPGHDVTGLMAQVAVIGFSFTFVALPTFAARLVDGRGRGQSVTLDRTTLTV